MNDFDGMHEGYSDEQEGYQVEWILGGDYEIGDSEYGYRLCRLSVFQDMKEALSGEQIHKIADDLAKLISVEILNTEKERNKK